MIRIGILLNSLILVPKWVADCLDKISKSDFCSIELFIVNGAKAKGNSSVSTLLQRRFYKLDRWKNRKYDILSPRVMIFPEQVSVMTLEPEMTTHTDVFRPADIETIRSFNLDVILRFGFRILRGEILKAAKYGVWSFHHGDNKKYRGGPPCYWEVLHGEKSVGQVLQILDDELDGGKIIDRAWTLAHNVSIIKTQHQAFSKTPSILMRSLQRLHDGNLQMEENIYYDQPLYKAPTNWQFIKLFIRYAWRKITAKRVKESELRWRLLYSHANEKSLYKFNELVPPKHRFYADPFIMAWKENECIFFEDYDHKAKKGRISAQILGVNSFVVLKEPFHLAYPFLFIYKGGLFMTVDSGLGDLRMYRFASMEKLELIYARRFEYLIHDPTVYFDGDLWWLFCSSTNDTLHLYYSGNPVSNNWTPHRLNPVVIDAAGARPAGALFMRDGKLFRPAQDYTSKKLYALRMKEIVTLTTANYVERDAGSIKPEWNDDVQGIHTFNSNGDMAVFDALYLK